MAESNGPVRIRGAQCMLGEHVPSTQHSKLSFPSAKRKFRKMQKNAPRAIFAEIAISNLPERLVAGRGDPVRIRGGSMHARVACSLHPTRGIKFPKRETKISKSAKIRPRAIFAEIAISNLTERLVAERYGPVRIRGGQCMPG